MSLPASDLVNSVRVGARTGGASGATCVSGSIFGWLRHRSQLRRDSHRTETILRDVMSRCVSVQPPECITSAPAGTVQSSGSASQPSGSATEAGEP